MLYLKSLFYFHFSVQTGLNALKFQMMHIVAYLSGNWHIFFYFNVALYILLLTTDPRYKMLYPGSPQTVTWDRI